MTEKALAQRAGHLEILTGGKRSKKEDSKKKDKSAGKKV
jgi:hypothetical protein